jgi:formamidopyrimidine-DNA glycosylase
MPELPEVETIVRGLRPHFLHVRIMSVQVRGIPVFKGSPSEFCRRLEGREIISIERHGKSIFLDLGPTSHNPPISLRIHLGMTGQLLIKTPEDSFESHTHLVFSFEGSHHELRYRDIRRFGEMEILLAPRAPSKIPDAWTSPKDELNSSLRNIKGFLKHALLSQKVVAGLGNIYVDEALHKAKLHPKRVGTRLRSAQWDLLTDSIKKVLADSIEVGGTSFRNYVDINGSRGGFKARLSVYGKSGQHCSCGARIKKILVAGRGTHFCPQCQPSPR